MAECLEDDEVCVGKIQVQAEGDVFRGEHERRLGEKVDALGGV